MIKTIIERSWNLIFYGHYIPVVYFVLDERKLVYISVPKVACTSIKIALMANTTHGGDDYAKYMRIHHDVDSLHHPHLPKHARNYFKFAFVRNPFDRLVSFYEDKVRRPTQHDGRYYFDSAYNKRLLSSLYGVTFSPDMNFADFVRLVARVPDWLADAHFKSQYAMLFHRGRQIPDLIGHFENLDRDWENLTQQYNIPPLEHKNATSTRNWHSYYTDREVIELVASRYRNDLLCFDYEGAYQDLLRSNGSPT